jgi:CHAT domain-containing protein
MGDEVRFFDVASPDALTGDGSAPPAHDAGSGSERPFAHPVYWGGFVLTGL